LDLRWGGTGVELKEGGIADRRLGRLIGRTSCREGRENFWERVRLQALGIRHKEVGKEKPRSGAQKVRIGWSCGRGKERAGEEKKKGEDTVLNEPKQADLSAANV